MRLVKSKNRAMQKKLETLSGHRFWYNLKLAQRGLQILTNKVKRSYSLRHTACRVH